MAVISSVSELSSTKLYDDSIEESGKWHHNNELNVKN